MLVGLGSQRLDADGLAALLPGAAAATLSSTSWPRSSCTAPRKERTRMSRHLFALALLISPTIPATVTAADPKADAELVRTAQAMLKDLRTTTLPNGLRVYLLPVKGSPVVTTMVAYRVGSGDEDKDQ